MKTLNSSMARMGASISSHRAMMKASVANERSPPLSEPENKKITLTGQYSGVQSPSDQFNFWSSQTIDIIVLRADPSLA
jgi:hypothetical protein